MEERLNKVTQRRETRQATRTGKQVQPESSSKGNAVTPAPYGIDFVDHNSSGELRAARRFSRTAPNGMPSGLQAGIESLSGIDLSDVQVHTNSSKPARINALAYAQGNEIHLGPGQQRHLPHEAWHIVQQRQGRVRPTIQAKGALINNDRGLESEADSMGARAQRFGSQPRHSEGSREANRSSVPTPSIPSRSSPSQPSGPIQRAIGLEIEVPVPVDDLTDLEVTAIKNDVQLESIATTPKDKLDYKLAAFQKARKVTYGTVRNTLDGFYVDVDHESRVISPDQFNSGWPMREGGQDSIMEIVTEKAETLAEFNTAMDKVSEFVDSIESHTDHLKTRWKDPFGTGVNVGPLDYSDIGIPRARKPNHGWMGSVQVNIGIDLREYASLAKWYAKSTYADPKRAPSLEQAIYGQSKANILEAVDVVRDMVNGIRKDLSSDDKKNMGNYRGLRGWLTHLALYMIGGRSGVPGTTAKNITPILLKSPQDIAIWYGMTTDESNYFLTNRKWMMSQLVIRTGRTDLDKDDPLSGDVVKGKATNQAYQSALGKGFVGLTKSEENAVVAYGVNLGDLSDYADTVVYAGKPVKGEQAVGPVRTGSTQVGAIPSVTTGGGDQRGGVVVEFRNLPGFYDGPAKWKALGQEFFKAADKRNKRGGVKP